MEGGDVGVLRRPEHLPTARAESASFNRAVLQETATQPATSSAYRCQDNSFIIPT